MTELTTSLLEKFVMAENKADVLKEVTPHSSLHKFIQAIIALNDPAADPASLAKLVAEVRHSGASSPQKETVQLKLLLNQLSAAKDRPDEFKKLAAQLNAEFLHYSFQHSNPFQQEFRSDFQSAEADKPAHSLTADQLKQLTLEAALERAYETGDLNDLTSEGLQAVDPGRFSPVNNFEQLTRFLNESRRLNGLKGLVPLANELMKTDRGLNYVCSELWDRLSLEHKEALLTPNSPLAHHMDKWGDVMELKFGLRRVEEGRLTLAEQGRLFEELVDYAKRLPAKFASLGRGFRLAAVWVHSKTGDLDKKRLIEYLKDPLNVDLGCFKGGYRRQVEDLRERNKEDRQADFGVPGCPSEEEVVRTALRHVFKTARDFGEFEEFLDSSYLARLFYEQKLLQGEEAPQAKEHLSEPELQRLFSERRVAFVEGNKRAFRKGDAVAVRLELKNVASLTVRLFEVSTLNYVLENRDRNYEKIDVSGLIPSSSLAHIYSHSPMVVHEETFKFAHIESAERGVFIVDFIGEDVKARCVIVKGQLSVVYEPLGGRSAVLVDEEGRVVKGGRTGLYVDRLFFEADGETGEVRLPESVDARQWDVVAVHNGFADIGKLQVSQPQPELSMGLLFNSETFQPGNQVQFVVEPKLRKFGRTADATELKNVQVTIETANDQGVSNSTVFPDLKVVRGEDLVVELIFPPKLVALTVQLKAELGEKDRRQTLETSRRVAIGKSSSNEVQSLYFQAQSSGAVRVYVLGRNGEPRRNQLVNLALNLSFVAGEKRFELVTNEQGFVEVGAVKGLSCLTAQSGPAYATYNKDSERLAVQYPDQLTVKSGEQVTLPFNTEFDAVVLSQLAEGRLVREFPAQELKRASNALTLPALQEGEYRLEIGSRQVAIRAVAGEYLEGKRLLRTREGIVSLPADHSCWFQSVRPLSDAWEVKLWSKRPEVKARLLTFNYLPSELGLLNFESAGFSATESAHLAEAVHYPCPPKENVYNKQTFLGDEIVYVYDRMSKKSFIGNTLEKPGAILKRNRVGETTETEQVARSGDRETASVSKCMARNDCMQMAQYNVEQMCEVSRCPPMLSLETREFLSKPGKLVTGLQVVDGTLRVPRALSQDAAFTYLSLSDGVFSSLVLLEKEVKAVEAKDLTLQRSRKEGFIYSYGREVKFARAGAATVVPNVGNSQLFMITSLKDFKDALLTLSPGLREQFREWEFVVDWAALRPMEKLKKYDKFASHELNLFVYCKDREFFEGVVRPFLANKREKQVVDHFLLGNVEAVADRLNVAAAESLPYLERLLLAVLSREKAPDFGRALLSHSRSYLAVNRLSVDQRKRLFETLMNVNAEGHAKFEAEKTADSQPFAEEGAGGEGPQVVGMMQSFGSPMVNLMSNIAPMATNFSYGAPPGRTVYRAAAAPRMLRGGVAKKKAMKVKEYKKEAEEAENDDFDGGLLEEEEQSGDDEQAIFQPAQGTVEYNERQYWQRPNSTVASGFFADLLEHLLANPSHSDFFSTEFLSGIDDLPSLLAALAFVDLPFERAKVSSSVKGSELTLTAAHNYCLLVKEVIEKRGERVDMEVQVSQKIYDPADPTVYDDEDPEISYDKPVEEFLTGRLYASRVVITNSTTSQVKVTLIAEIPEGSIALDLPDALRIRDLTIAQFHSEVYEFMFYFPKAGSFGLFPATVVKGGRIAASAKGSGPLEVRAEKSARGLKTMADVMANGNIGDIVEFMKTKNLLNPRVFQWSHILWLLKNREFYEKVVALLSEKGVFEPEVWSYSLFHGDFPRLRELLAYRQSSGQAFPQLPFHRCALYAADQFEVREYFPLINPRAHLLGKATTNIINNTFKKTYDEFLRYLFLKFRPSADDYVLLVNFLIAQDQVEKALAVSGQAAARATEVSSLVQFEYQQAYLSFITGYPDFAKAKALCEKYLTYPVLSWRNLFVEMANQLAEFEESDSLFTTGAKAEGEALNKEKAKKAASLSASLEGDRVRLVTSQVPEVSIRFYKVELEVVFSLQPFDFQSRKEYAFVAPFSETTVPTSDQGDTAVTLFAIPPGAARENLFIEVRAANDRLQKSEYLTYVPFRLNCFVTREFGILKCFEPESNKPVPRVYVKCFAKYAGGDVKFYKDGYTDLRGSFDYVSLNTDKVDNIDSFAILVTSPEHGSKVLVEKPPAKIGSTEGQAKKLISEEWAKKREQNVQRQQKAMANQYAMLY